MTSRTVSSANLTEVTNMQLTFTFSSFDSVSSVTIPRIEVAYKVLQLGCSWTNLNLMVTTLSFWSSDCTICLLLSFLLLQQLMDLLYSLVLKLLFGDCFPYISLV